MPSVALTHALSQGIVERWENGMLLLSPSDRSPIRRVLFVNSYGGSWAWGVAKRGVYPSHHLWGCPELVRLGYEVALVNPIADFQWSRAIPHDFGLLRAAITWLGRDGILYCGHNVLFWTAVLRRLGVVRCRLVSLLFGRESLRMPRAHAGVIGLTPAAAENARRIAPQARVVHLGWGADLQYYPQLPYEPRWFVSCGKTLRDSETLSAAAARCRSAIHVIGTGLRTAAAWPANVTVFPGAGVEKNVNDTELFHEHYAGSTAALVILTPLPSESGAPGFTSMLEAMALARPVIVTRTGALAGELDIEAAGCGVFVPPADPEALAAAMRSLADDPIRARTMGERGRQICERHYNITRYASALHKFFETL